MYIPYIHFRKKTDYDVQQHDSCDNCRFGTIGSTKENNNIGFKALIEEKDRHIETLKAEIEKAGQREEKLNENHRNYMLQMQSLIDQSEGN